MVNIFSPWEQRVIARCQGHSSFLSALAFDDLRCDGRTYRFGSVGEDNKLILVKHVSHFSRIDADMTPTQHSGIFRVEYSTVPSHTHTTNAFLWPRLYLLLPVAVPGPTRSPLTTRRFSSHLLVPKALSRATIPHRPAMRSQLYNPFLSSSSRTTC